METYSKKIYIRTLSIIALLFFIVGFSLGINSIVIPFIRQSLELSTAESYMVLTATYSIFVVCGYPSSLLLKKYGYKKTMLLSFLFFLIGMYLFVPSAKSQSFALFLLASIILGIGNAVLQAAINPYITLLGNIDSAATRISIMGIINKVAWAVAPIFLGIFFNLTDAQLLTMIKPFYLIVIFIAICLFLIFIVPIPEIHADGEVEDNKVYSIRNLVKYPHLTLGCLALFCDIGLETLSMASIVDYAIYNNLSNPQLFTSYTVIAMIIGYSLGIILIPKYITQEKALKVCSIMGLIASGLIIIVPGKISILFLASLGLANSLLWPTIWPLALKDLGSLTKLGSSLLVMGIVGGAIVPLIFGYFCDILNNMQFAYAICIPLYMIIYYYSIKGYKIRPV